MTIALTQENRSFIDLVQIRCPATATDDGSFGSGLLVRPGIILTALHCVAIKERAWTNRGEIRVHLWRDLRENEGHHYTATIVWRLPFQPGQSDPADLAVLAIDGDDLPTPILPATFSELPPNKFLAHTIGFPGAAAGQGLLGGRVEHRQFGEAYLVNEVNRALGFIADASAERAGKEAWGGLSGGPLYNDEAVVGVMREVPDAWDGHNVLRAEPLPALLRDPGNRDLRRQLLGIIGPWKPAQVQAPAPPPERTSDPEFHLLWQYLYTCDRTQEVGIAFDGIGRHYEERTVELLVAGQPEDRCEEFFNRIWCDVLRLVDNAPAAGDTSIGDPTPPSPLIWPAAGTETTQAANMLSLQALNALMPNPGFKANLGRLRAKLEDTVQLPFLAISLPRQAKPEDLALLEEWRAAWRGVKRATRPGQFVGYALLYSAATEPPPELLLNRTGTVADGLGQVVVSLGEIGDDQIALWQQQLRDRESRRPSGATTTSLSLIASRVAEMIKERKPKPLRLGTINRLLIGEPAWYEPVA
jgi:hypothetical protein